MRSISIACLAVLVGSCHLAALTREVDFVYLPVPDNVTRSEVRAGNSDGTLFVGNIQVAESEGQLQSMPVYWLNDGQNWELKSLPGMSLTDGFFTFSAINSYLQEWLVGRAWNGTRTEGYAHNYVSGETVWGGALEQDLVGSDASLFTGVTSDGVLFCGSAARNDQLDAPVIYNRDAGELQEVPVPEGFVGGWLYEITGDAQAPSGAGFLYQLDGGPESVVVIPARWTPEEGMVPLPLLAEGKSGYVLRISLDGATGFGQAVNQDDIQVPTIWHLDQGGQPEALPLPEGQGYRFGEAEIMDPVTGWISGSVFYDEDPEDGVPGQWEAFLWDTGRVPRPAADVLNNRYGIDFGAMNVQESNPSSFGGGFYGLVTDEGGEEKAYILKLRARAAGFDFLDPMPGGDYYAEARAISDDGSRIAGISSGHPSGTIGSLWTEGQGWQHMPAPEGTQYTPFFLPASDMTPDGQFIVGRSPSETGTPVAYVWNNSQSTFYRLTEQEGTLSRMTGISFDGSVAVGQSAIPDELSLHAMVVREGTPSLLSYPAGASESWAYDVSGNGQVAVGWATFPDFSSVPVLWTVADGNHQTLPLPDGAVGVDVLAVDESGSVIAGGAYFDVGGGNFLPRPVYWDADRNPVLIPDLGEFQFGAAWSVSADGSLILGQLLNADYTDARGFIYQVGAGTRDLHTWFLEEHQVYLDQEYKPSVLRISANGQWLCGTGRDPLVINSNLAFRIKVPEKTAEDAFGSDTAPIGDSGFVQTWFGLIKDELYPIVHHQEHGWLEMSAWGPDGGYYFDTVLGWIFVERGSYPIMQLLPEGAAPKWIFYEEGSVAPRRFYDYDKQDWVTEDQL